jgi:hypothetical protein
LIVTISPPPALAAIFTGAGGQGNYARKRINFSIGHRRKTKITKEK